MKPKSYEISLRRMAKRLGLEMQKSRARRVRVDDHGLWRIVTARGHVLAGETFELTLDDVSAWLDQRERELVAERAREHPATKRATAAASGLAKHILQGRRGVRAITIESTGERGERSTTAVDVDPGLGVGADTKSQPDTADDDVVAARKVLAEHDAENDTDAWVRRQTEMLKALKAEKD